MESYDGRHIGCAPGTHAAVADAVARATPSREGVLDIGAHSGALLARFRSAGFSDLVGVDLDPTRFDLEDASFHRFELNEDFSHLLDRGFSVVTATDVIEHLDNPRHFVSQVRKLLKPEGIFALSFPNVGFWEGRVKFLLKGELWGFGERNYRKQRHISPMTHDQSRLMFKELGFEVVSLFAADSFSTP